MVGSKSIEELRKQRELAFTELERMDEEISKLVAEQRYENVKRVLMLMNELGVSLSDLEQKGKPIKAMTKKGKIIDAVFRDPKTKEPFSNRGSYGKRIQRLLDAGVAFEDIVIDKDRVEELKKTFLANQRGKADGLKSNRGV